MRKPDHEERLLLVKAVIFLALSVAVVMCSGCNTFEAVQQAPPEFWLTAERIVIALWDDIVSIVELIL